MTLRRLPRGFPGLGLGWGVWRRGLVGEVLSVAWQEAAEDLVGLLTIGGASHAQLAGQAVLKGPPEALDAAFGLRRQSMDELNPQLIEKPAELSRFAMSRQLLLQRELAQM